MTDPNAAWRGMKPPSVPLRRKRMRAQTYAEPPLFEVDPSTWSAEEKLVFSNVSPSPTQQDTIIEKVGLPTSATLTALLTLSLKDVVVEGPDGFFRRRIAL
jgi:DNA processing protein